MSSKDFSRVAADYDATRGGNERGERHAAMVAEHLRAGDLVLEVAVGTGLVAEPLAARGFQVLGADLSVDMLRRAIDRIGPRVVAADAGRLPFRTASVDAVVSIWTLHVVGDREAMVAEVSRVLRPGGRWVVVPAQGFEPSEYQRIMQRMYDGLGSSQRFKGSETLTWLDEVAPGFGLVSVGQEALPPRAARETLPGELIDGIERRMWTPLWDVDEDAWRAHVEPAIAALRALPDQQRPRVDTIIELVGIYERTR